MWISWHSSAWDDYLDWSASDRKVAKRINLLVKELSRSDPAEKPIGQAERIRHSKHGLCSVRIDRANRLVYKLDGESLRIVSCRGHYELGEVDADL